MSVKGERVNHTRAGFDVYTMEDKKCPVNVMVKIAVTFDTPIKPGYFAIMYGRTSACREGLMVVPTVVDALWTDNISLWVINNSIEDKILKQGAKIAQLVYGKLVEQNEAVRFPSKARS